MRMWLSEIFQIFSQPFQGEDQLITGISTDSRSTRRGDLFVALTGKDFDGHDFIDQAFSRGAVASLVSKEDSVAPYQRVYSLEVKDTIVALGKLAAHWHQFCQSEADINENKSQTIAITGSVGKTTVKEMLFSMLHEDIKVCATKGNFNNAIGLPLTLFNESPEDVVAIVEMGANAAGEIKALCDIAVPDIGIITQVAEAHLEGFNDLNGIANAKAELFSGLSESGIAIVNADIKSLPVLVSAAADRDLIRVALNAGEGADVWAEDIQAHQQTTSFNYCSTKAKIAVRLSLSGQHNVLNALLAITGVIAAGFDANERVKYLENMAEIPGRLNSHPTKNGGLVIDDSYNANPASVRAAIDYLASFSKRKILVLGNMGELGSDEKSLHEQCGKYAYSHGVDAIYTLGDLASEASKVFYKYQEKNGNKNSHQNYVFESSDELVKSLEKELDNKSTILIKGSRAAKMEKIVQSLLDADRTLINKNKIKEECL